MGKGKNGDIKTNHEGHGKTNHSEAKLEEREREREAIRGEIEINESNCNSVATYYRIHRSGHLLAIRELTWPTGQQVAPASWLAWQPQGRIECVVGRRSWIPVQAANS